MLNIVILSKSHLKKLKEYKLALILTIAVVFVSFSQNSIGIGTATPDPSAVLDVSSSNKGLLPPRMNTIEMNAINSPAEGLIVYCKNCTPKGIYIYDGEKFRQLQFFKNIVEVLSIPDLNLPKDRAFFDITPTLTPSGATVNYSLVNPPQGVSIDGNTISIGVDMALGSYNIIVKAKGNGDYIGKARTIFRLTLIPSDNFVITIPDSNFRRIVKTKLGIGVDEDITYGDIKNIASLNVSNRGHPLSEKIHDMTGIEHFTALTILGCSGNQLRELDLSQNTRLAYLDCSDNSISNLNVRKNTYLSSLYCYENTLQNLNLSQNTYLTILSCTANSSLTHLDIRGLRSLAANLNFSYGNLIELKVHKNIKNSQKIINAKTSRVGRLTIHTYSAATGRTNYLLNCSNYIPRRDGGICR